MSELAAKESYGRGKSSPLVWLSNETRSKVDVYLDEAIEEMIKTAGSVGSQSEEHGRRL